MKKHFLGLLATSLLLTSCLKEDSTLDPKDSNAVIEVYNFRPAQIASSVESTYPLFVQTFEIVPSVDYDVVVNYAGEGTAPVDIQVVLDFNTDAIDVFNDENHSNYIELPSTHYTVDSWTLTIPKGQKQATAKFKLKTDQFDFAEAYIMPVRIKTVSSGVISKNYGTVLFSVGAKNEFDGVYRYSTSAITSLLPNRVVEVELETQSANKCKLNPGLLGYYSNAVSYMVDYSTNHVTVECPSLGVQTPQDSRSVYDPANKKLTVYWKQGNGGRTFEETFVYLRPR